MLNGETEIFFKKKATKKDRSQFGLTCHVCDPGYKIGMTHWKKSEKHHEAQSQSSRLLKNGIFLKINFKKPKKHKLTRVNLQNS